MARPQVTHITRKRGTIYYYRRRLPRPHMGDISLSLDTDHYREAEYLATLLDHKFDTFFKDEIPMVNIKAILRENLRAALEDDRQHHLNTLPRRPVYAIGIDLLEDPREADADIVRSLWHDTKVAIARREPDLIQDELEQLMKIEGVTEEHRNELKFGLLQVRLQFLEQAMGNLKGGAVGRIELEETVTASVSPKVESELTGESVLFSTAVEGYVDYGVSRKGWTKQSLSQNEMAYRGFVQICGDLPVHQYQRKHLTQFFDLLQRLPSQWSKGREWRDMQLETIAQVADSGNHQLLSMKTISRYFSALSGFFEYLKTRGEYEGENPAKGFKFPENKKSNEKRQMWKGDKLVTLLSSSVWSGCATEHRRSLSGDLIIEDAKYWLPLLGLYHGNRLEEFAQLRREDIQVKQGIWFMNITDDGERQVKSDASVRRVPLHPRIQSLGFLDYVASVAPEANNRVFPRLVAGGADMKYGHSFSKWFTRYRRDIGVYERGLDYHSFRAGVETKLHRAGVPEIQIDELLGHVGGGTGRRVYKKEPLPLEMLHEAICKVAWEEDTVIHPH